MKRFWALFLGVLASAVAVRLIRRRRLASQAKLDYDTSLEDREPSSDDQEPSSDDQEPSSDEQASELRRKLGEARERVDQPDDAMPSSPSESVDVSDANEVNTKISAAESCPGDLGGVSDDDDSSTEEDLVAKRMKVHVRAREAVESMREGSGTDTDSVS
tara:strand:+ start:405 stop:884 length:480 start_codon:yes stop_codon:yes gene_type:complete